MTMSQASFSALRILIHLSNYVGITGDAHDTAPFKDNW